MRGDCVGSAAEKAKNADVDTDADVGAWGLQVYPHGTHAKQVHPGYS
jgi:hypothetical protein